MPSDAKRLARLVIDMRTAQRVFYRRKGRDDLIRAKVLEKEVDEMCKRVLSRKEQGYLWGEK